jgi:hypothetical protein
MFIKFRRNHLLQLGYGLASKISREFFRADLKQKCGQLP